MKKLSVKQKFFIKAGLKTAAAALLIGMLVYNALPDYYFYDGKVSEGAFGTLSSSEETAETQIININTAPSAVLQRLNGIGLVKARAIVAYREENGAFSSVDELINVKGIGEATLEKIRDDITV